MSTVQVSVLMPVYNAERYVAEAVESILGQTFRDFEFLIIDDGSTDRSLEILRKYEKQDPRIRLISRPNTGIVGALNDGLALCAGKYVARMDADDVAYRERLCKQVEYMEANPRCALLGAAVDLCDVDGTLFGIARPCTDQAGIDSDLLRGDGQAVIHPVSMMRLEMVFQVGLYRPEMQWVEDLDLFARLSESFEVANLPDVLLKYRRHEQSVNFTRFDEQRNTVLRAVADSCRRRGLAFDPSSIGKPRERSVVLRDMAWAMLSGGHLSAARRAAWRCLRNEPLSRESWLLVACCMRGY